MIQNKNRSNKKIRSKPKYKNGGSKKKKKLTKRSNTRSTPRGISRSRKNSKKRQLDFINQLFYKDQKPFFIRASRSKSNKGITRGCYSSVFLILLRYVLRSLFKNPTDKNLYLDEEILWKLINTPLKWSLENVFSREIYGIDDETKTLRQFLEKLVLENPLSDECNNVINVGGTLDLLYSIVTAQIIGNGPRESFRENLVSLENTQTSWKI